MSDGPASAGMKTPTDGLQIDVPRVFVPWGITEGELAGLVGGDRLRHVTDGYFTMSCGSLGGVSHRLGFHFLPRTDGRLAYFEFFREHPEPLARSFDDFQLHLVRLFGEPTSYGDPFYEERGKRGLPTCRWAFGDVEIVHYAMDRFGPEEHLFIRKIPAAPHLERAL